MSGYGDGSIGCVLALSSVIQPVTAASSPLPCSRRLRVLDVSQGPVNAHTSKRGAAAGGDCASPDDAQLAAASRIPIDRITRASIREARRLKGECATSARTLLVNRCARSRSALVVLVGSGRVFARAKTMCDVRHHRSAAASRARRHFNHRAVYRTLAFFVSCGATQSDDSKRNQTVRRVSWRPGGWPNARGDRRTWLR